MTPNITVVRVRARDSHAIAETAGTLAKRFGKSPAWTRQAVRIQPLPLLGTPLARCEREVCGVTDCRTPQVVR